MVLFSFIGTLGIRERIEPIKKERYKTKEFFKVLAARPIYTHFLSALASSIASGAGTAAIIYYVTYIVGNPELIGLFVIFVVLGNFIGFFVGRPILSKYGKKYTLVIGSFITNIPLLFIILSPSNVGFLILIIIISSIGGGFAMIVGYGLQADNTDYVEWKQGNRTEAAIASLVSFVNKAGLGIGAALVGFILALTGYMPNVSQSPLAVQGIIWSYAFIPALLGLTGGLIILFFYPLTQSKITEMALALQQKRQL